MRTHSFRSALLPCLLPLTFIAAAQADEPKREGAWILNDLPAAQAEARKTGKPIFAVFRCER